jgi:hypothetical protein
MDDLLKAILDSPARSSQSFNEARPAPISPPRESSAALGPSHKPVSPKVSAPSHEKSDTSPLNEPSDATTRD